MGTGNGKDSGETLRRLVEAKRRVRGRASDAGTSETRREGDPALGKAGFFSALEANATPGGTVKLVGELMRRSTSGENRGPKKELFGLFRWPEGMPSPLRWAVMNLVSDGGDSPDPRELYPMKLLKTSRSYEDLAELANARNTDAMGRACNAFWDEKERYYRAIRIREKNASKRRRGRGAS